MLQVKIIQRESFELVKDFNTRINKFLSRFDGEYYILNRIEYFRARLGNIESVVITYEVEGDSDV